MTIRCIALLAALALLAACTGSGSAPHSTPPSALTAAVATPLLVKGPNSFVSVRTDPARSSVAISDARTGRITKVLLPERWHSMTVLSTAVDAAGHIWVGLAKGPTCTNGLASCGPKPNSCASEVVTITPDSNAPHEVLQGSPGELMTDAQPSPDGTMLAYLVGVCDRAYFNQHLRVRNLKTGQSWDIGAGLPPCHALSSIAWSSDGRRLAVAYGRSLVKGTPSSLLGVGMCSANAPKQLAVVPALAPAAGLPGTVVAADRNCEIEAATATKTGYAAIEACRGSGDNPGSFLAGPVQLLHFDKSLHITGRTSIGHCADGAELRADATGTELLGTTYQYCAPGTNGQPRTVTFTDTGEHLTTIIDELNRGSSSVRAIGW